MGLLNQEEFNKALSSPMMQIGLGLLSNSDGRRGSFGRGLAQGVNNYAQYQQLAQQQQQGQAQRQQAQKEYQYKMQQREAQAQKMAAQKAWVAKNMPGMVGAPQAMQNSRYAQMNSAPQRPSALQEKIDLLQNNPGLYERLNPRAAPKQRRRYKGADGYNYWEDNNKRLNPDIKKAETGTAVYGPDGNMIYSSGGLDPTKLTNTSKSSVQKKVLGAQEQLSSLDRAHKGYADEYLTHAGRAKAWLGGAMDKFGMKGDLVQFNKERTGFIVEVRQLFNDYRRIITGAAASEKEMESLLASMMNEEMGPEEFKAAYAQFREKAEANMELNLKQLGVGFPQEKDTTGRNGRTRDDLSGFKVLGVTAK